VLDVRSDIYALGAILYELLAERPIFDLRKITLPEAARIIREEDPTRLGSINSAFRGDIDTIVCKALVKDRDQRYHNATELAADIRRCLTHEPIIAHPPSLYYQLSKLARRHKGLVVGVALSFLILIAGTVISLILTMKAVKGEERALQNEAKSERNLYRMNIAAADAVGKTEPLRGLKHLESVPVDKRGWEWRRMYASIDTHISEYTAKKGSTSMLRAPIQLGARLASPMNSNPLAAIQCENGIELINMVSGKVETVFELEGEITGLDLSFDGTRIVTLSRTEKKLADWDVQDKTCIFETPMVTDDINNVRLNSDGSLIVISSNKDGTKVIDTATGRSIFETAPYPSHTYHAVISNNNERLAIVGGNRGSEVASGGWFFLYVYSSEGERLVDTMIGEGLCSLAINPEGTRIAIGHRQRMISIYDAFTLEKLSVLYGHTSLVTALAFSPDSAYLASSAADKTTRIWDLSSNRTVRVFRNHPAAHPPISTVFSQDGELLAAGNTDGARLWSWRGDTHHVLKGHDSYVYNVLFNPDSSLIASSDYNKRICIWRALTGELLASIARGLGRPYLSLASNGVRSLETVIWDYAAYDHMKSTRTDSGSKAPKQIGFSQNEMRSNVPFIIKSNETRTMSYDRSMVAVVYASGEVSIRETSSDKLIKRLGEHNCKAYTVAFKPDGSRLVSGDISGIIKVWDVENGNELVSFQGHQAEVFSVVYSPDGSRIVSGGNDGVIILWDGTTFEQVATFRGHKSYVHSVAFSPDGTMLVSGSGDKTVRIWDSISRAERMRQIRKVRELQHVAEPIVECLMKELGDPLEVVDRLREDKTMDKNLRREAILMLYRYIDE